MNPSFFTKAKQLDLNDPLSEYRNAFYLPKKNDQVCIYLRGNSLGLQPCTTHHFVEKELQKWRDLGAEGHYTGDKPWVSYHHLAKKTLSVLVGAGEHEVTSMNNLTTNLHMAMMSFYQPDGKRNKIMIEKGAFPSDYYAVHSQIQSRGLDPEECLIELTPSDGSDYLSTQEIVDEINKTGEELSLVMFAGVQYYTGQFFNIKKITEAAHSVGALAGFDLAHAVGNVPLHLHHHEVDFAVWCSYKYLNSGPGSVGGMFIHEKHGQNKALKRLSGWWGHESKGQFKKINEINPIPTVDGWKLSNTNILSCAAHLASLELFEKVGMEALRAKSILLTGLMEEAILSTASINKHIKIITPTHQGERGCQLSLSLLNHGEEVASFMRKKGVILDWREPNLIRIAPVPFYNTYQEVIDFAALLTEALDEYEVTKHK